MTGSVLRGRVGVLSSVARVVAVLSFGGYFAMLAIGDLFPMEQLGAAFVRADTVVSAVTPDGPAARAGVMAGDRIVAVEGRPIRNTLDWAAVFARVEEGQPVTFTIERRSGPIELIDLRFGRRPYAPWTTPQGVVVLLGRLAQLLTLLFATAIVRRAQSAEGWLGFWLLATIAIYSVGLPPRMAVVWRELPFALEALFFLPSVSKVVIGFILFAFFRVLIGRRLSDPATALVALPFVLCVVWHARFVISLLYRPSWLPTLTPYIPFVIIVNLAGVVAALVMLGLEYRRLADSSARHRLRWIVAGSIIGCAAAVPTVAGIWIGAADPTLAYHAPLGVQLMYSAFLLMPIAVWWAIARRQLFDIRVVIRRGLQYLFARGREHRP